MRQIEAIIIHCSYTYSTMDTDAADIRRWHTEDNGWNDIGYHFVIRRDGTVEDGRPIERAGAHVAGHNARTIGVCIVGGKARAPHPATNFTAAQWEALRDLVAKLKLQFPSAVIRGHYHYDRHKTCPTFDVEAWAEGI